LGMSGGASVSDQDNASSAENKRYNGIESPPRCIPSVHRTDRDLRSLDHNAFLAPSESVLAGMIAVRDLP
jgi:hypothetical protein